MWEYLKNNYKQFINKGVQKNDLFNTQKKIRLINHTVALSLGVLIPTYMIYSLVNQDYIHFISLIISSILVVTVAYLNQHHKNQQAIHLLFVVVCVHSYWVIYNSDFQTAAPFLMLLLCIGSFLFIEKYWLRNLWAFLSLTSFFVLQYYQINYLSYSEIEFLLIIPHLVLIFFALKLFENEHETYREQIIEHNQMLNEQKEEIRQQAEQLIALDKAKNHFFANISHEFRTPLTSILECLRQLSLSKQSPQEQQLLQISQRNSKMLEQLINQLLDLAKLEEQKLQLNLSVVSFEKYIERICQSFNPYANYKEVDFQYDITKNPLWVHIDTLQFEKILNNLLSNAFKFTLQGQRVLLILENSDNEAIVKIIDTGIGIPKKELSFIFNRFYQVNDPMTKTQIGTGIGLSLVKELVMLHKGTIEVESELGNGTTFTLKIPLHKNIDNQKDIFENTINFYPSEVFLQHDLIVEEEVKIKKEKPMVLVVEDHPELQFLIREILKDEYDVFIAQNGQEGIDKAISYIPDLIISDVMMPQKTGYELCNTLKSDQRTSHIPIILLTAKATQSDKLRGLEQKADEYLYKPFDYQELLIRTQNLIETRQTLRLKFSQEIKINPSEVATNQKDSDFLQKVTDIAEKNYSDALFSITEFADAIHLSPSQFNRKLKALIEQSPNQFLQNYRLQKATELLQHSDKQIAEIAYMAGFNSPSYFVKCFKEKFSKTPKVFQDESK
jgi:signal transduction histidine kinase/DNA-binding response OmpR family regulator